MIPLTPSRRLLARLRDVMAGTGSAQARLDKIVRLIAAEMVAEVGSCYVSRPGEVLELFATVGLNPDAVHNTRLRVGEGLVGEVAATARPMAIANAFSHPKFVYRPETGEDPYQSFLGVPLMRGGKVRGVLVVQNRRSRHYSEEEVETLQTIAMVVAELVAGGEMGGPGEVAGSDGGSTLPERIDGMPLNAGLASGLAVLHQPQITIREMVADDPDREIERLRAAVTAMHASLDDLLALTSDSGNDAGRDVLETYRMFAEDRGWLQRIAEAIHSGLSAEAAVQKVQNDMRARMARVTDPYLRERMSDFNDLATRLLLNLSGRSSAAAMGTLPEDVVVVARSIGPAELLDYEHHRLRALVLEEGSAVSHVSIVAKALDIPIVGRCRNALALIEPFDPILVDGDNGQVFVRPAEDVQEAFHQTLELRARQRKAYAGLVGRPAETRDGVRIAINLNAGLLIDLPHLVSSGADGIGLFRTEIPFMVRSEFPSVASQTETYEQVLDQADGRPVQFRTLDVGGDKILPYFDSRDQNNPALGWRALRIGLDRPSMLLAQLRALVRASGGRTLRVMFPMVAEVAEFETARALLDRELARAANEGRKLPEQVEVGAMVEVPALVWQVEKLVQKVDFLAVGTNDLMQFTFAADRSDPQVSRRYDPLSPAFLRLLATLVEHADAAGKRISVCGEMAGKPLEALALIALGYRSLSMAPGSIGPVKSAIRRVDLSVLTALVAELRGRDGRTVRPELAMFAQDQGITIR